MENKITITRTINEDKQTLGVLKYKNFTCFTLELPWKNNQNDVSCIPKGIYKVSKRNSSKYGEHLHILDVPNRTFILVHSGNYYKQIQGCVLVGDSLIDLNKDKYKDVTNSKKTLEKLLSILPNSNLILEIRYDLTIQL